VGWETHRRRAFAFALAPALVVLAATTVVPAIYLVVTSLTPLNPVNPGTALDFSCSTKDGSWARSPPPERW
jgi:multiple sugar transport system permease protein